MIIGARYQWIGAYKRRLPNRDTAPHREMLEAFGRDVEARLLENFKDRLLENDLAREIEREMEGVL